MVCKGRLFLRTPEDRSDVCKVQQSRVIALLFYGPEVDLGSDMLVSAL